MTVDSIAGFGGLIFSAIIGIAMYISEGEAFGNGMGKRVSALFVVGILGFLTFPVSVTSQWSTLDIGCRIITICIDILSLAAVIVLGYYFYYYFRHKNWLKQNIEAVFPPEKPLIPG